MIKKVLVLIVVIVVAGAAWYFVSPLFIDKTVDEDFPEIPTEEEMQDMTREEIMDMEKDIVEKLSEMPDDVVTEEMPESMPEDPTILYSGTFRDGDNFHKGEGSARIHKLADGSRILRLEDFSVTNGPSLFVLLVEDSNPEDSEDVQRGYIELAKLKGNKGDQNYQIDEDVDLSKYGSVVIYCKPFHVVFSVASLES